MKAALAAVLAAAVAAPVRAAETSPAKPWMQTAQLTFLSANGNTKSSTFGAKEEFKYDWGWSALELTTAALGARQAGVSTAEQFDAAEKYLVKAGERNYLFEKAGWNKDRFAGIRNRLDVSVGYGREILKGVRNDWVAELGGGYVNEQRVAPPREEFASGRAYTKYVRSLSETAKASQDVEYLHNFNEPDAYRLNAETAVTASITPHFSLKTSFTWKKVNVPPPGFAKNDTSTAVALIFNY